MREEKREMRTTTSEDTIAVDSLAGPKVWALAALLYDSLEQTDPTDSRSFMELEPLERIIYLDGVLGLLRAPEMFEAALREL